MDDLKDSTQVVLLVMATYLIVGGAVILGADIFALYAMLLVTAAAGPGAWLYHQLHGKWVSNEHRDPAQG